MLIQCCKHTHFFLILIPSKKKMVEYVKKSNKIDKKIKEKA